MSTNGYLPRSGLCSVVTNVDFGWYSSIVGTRPFASLCPCVFARAGCPIPINADSVKPTQVDTTRQADTHRCSFIFIYLPPRVLPWRNSPRDTSCETHGIRSAFLRPELY